MAAKHTLAAAALAFTFSLAGGHAGATSINTAGETDIMHTRYCAELANQLSRAKLDYTCTTSPGPAENVKRVAADPRQIGMGSIDVVARETAKLMDPSAIVQIRSDDLRQCLFAVTRNRDLQSFGDLSAHAAKLRFILPPAETVSADTFAILQQIDPQGLGQAGRVQHAASNADAAYMALSADDTVAFFVQFPDPEERTFKLSHQLGGHFIPVIDREVLRQQADGQKLYFAQETQVANADWFAAGQKVVTACAPVVVYTGAPGKVPEGKARQDQEDLIATVKALRTEVLLPPESGLSRALRRSKELSATSAEQLMKASEQAREKAKPYLDSAKEAADKAYEATKPALEQAKDYGMKAYERAREGLKQWMAPKPAETPPTEPAPK